MPVKYADTFSVYNDTGLLRRFSTLSAATSWVTRRRLDGDSASNYFVFNAMGLCVSSSRGRKGSN